jgi:hypothetical protein
MAKRDKRRVVPAAADVYVELPPSLPDALRAPWMALAPAAVAAGTLTPATVAGFVDGVLAPVDLARWMRARIELDGLVVIGPAGYQAHPLLREYAALLPALRAGFAQYALAPVDLGAALAALEGDDV